MEGFQKLSFGYDYRGRRVRKTVYTYNGTSETSWVQTGDTKYVWAGWLLLLELDGTDSDAVLRKYTWGLDLAGQGRQVNSLESAGGIGGLLAVYDTNGTTSGQNPTEDDKTYVYLYDANGNVGQLVDWTDIPDWGTKGLNSAQDWHADRLVARYEYDPYGNVVGPDTDSDGDWTDDAGPYATVNAFRFSTKQWDDETGLGYWGYRYYSPTLGRWMSRDPIAEQGGLNLYAYVGNSPTSRVDPLGQWCLPELSTSVSLGEHRDYDQKFGGKWGSAKWRFWSTVQAFDTGLAVSTHVHVGWWRWWTFPFVAYKSYQADAEYELNIKCDNGKPSYEPEPGSYSQASNIYVTTSIRLEISYADHGSKLTVRVLTSGYVDASETTSSGVDGGINAGKVSIGSSVSGRAGLGYGDVEMETYTWTCPCPQKDDR